MPAQLLIEYLDRSGVSYQLQSHPSAYTASEVAQASHIHGHNLAKAVMVKLDGELTMLVLPAHYHLDLDLLAGTLGAERAVLATESEFVHRFPRCEAGAMPPMGLAMTWWTAELPPRNSTALTHRSSGSMSAVISTSKSTYWSSMVS